MSWFESVWIMFDYVWLRFDYVWIVFGLCLELVWIRIRGESEMLCVWVNTIPWMQLRKSKMVQRWEPKNKTCYNGILMSVCLCDGDAFLPFIFYLKNE